MILASLRDAFPNETITPGTQKTLHPGLTSFQPSGLFTPEAWSNISPGYASFAYPGLPLHFTIRTPQGCEDGVRLDERGNPDFFIRNFATLRLTMS